MAVLSTQMSPSRLLALPAELTCMISAFVMTDLCYNHVPQHGRCARGGVPWRCCKRSFDKLRGAVSLIWVNQRFRSEAMPYFQANLTVCVYSTVYISYYPSAQILRFPLIVRQHATRLFDVQDQACKTRTFRSCLQPLLNDLQALKHVVWTFMQELEAPKMEDFGKLLQGHRDEYLLKILSKKEACGRLVGAVSPCTVTVKMVIDVEIYGRLVGGNFEIGLIDSLYMLEVDAVTGEIMRRMVNLSVDEDRPVWYPAEQTCLMIENVCLPVLYHIPSGDRRALTELWPWYASHRVYMKAEKRLLGRLVRNKVKHAVPELDGENNKDNTGRFETERSVENRDEGGGCEKKDSDSHLGTSALNRVLSLAQQVEDDLTGEIFLERALQTAQRL